IPRCTLVPYTTLFRSVEIGGSVGAGNPCEGGVFHNRAKQHGHSCSRVFNFFQCRLYLTGILHVMARYFTEGSDLAKRFLQDQNRSEEHTSELQSRENL